MSRDPLRIQVGPRSLLVLFNVVCPKSRVQKGNLSRFSIFFYRDNSRYRSRNIVVKGPGEMFVSAPSSGSSWILSLQDKPFYIGLTKLNFKQATHLVKPFGVQAYPLHVEFKVPISPRPHSVRQNNLNLNVARVGLKINRKSLEISQVFNPIEIDSSHEAIFASNPSNAKFIEHYEST